MKKNAIRWAGIAVVPVLTAAMAVPMIPGLFGQTKVRADEEIPVTDRYFPDEAFRNFVKTNYDVNPSDGILSEAECKAVKTVKCQEAGIQDLTGIGYFTEVTYLNCSGNALKTLNLERNPKIAYLYCYENELESITLNENVNLRQVFCQDNCLTALDLKQSTTLLELNCKNNALTSLDVSMCSKLEQLNLAGNEVTSLDVTKNTNLTFLSLADNLVASLNLSNNQKLTELNCSYNRLKNLNVKGHTELKKLYCHLNSLTTLNLSGCANLQVVNCSSNYLTSQPTVPSGCSLTYSPQSATYDDSVAITKTTFPDKNFRAFVIDNYDVDPHDEYLSSTEIKKVKNMTCENNGYRTLQGIEYFTNLRQLVIWRNQLTELDLSKNTKLTYIDIGKNPIESIDFSSLENLNSLSLNGISLKTLNLSKNTNLQNLAIVDLPNLTKVQLDNSNLMLLFINDLKLSGLDLSKCTSLETLSISGCGLKSLDLSNNDGLAYLYCRDNMLSELDLKMCSNLADLDCSKNQITSLDLTNCSEIRKLCCEDNLLMDLDLSHCTKLENVTCQHNYLEKQPKVPQGCELVYNDQYLRSVPVDAAYFPDQAFRNYVSGKCDINPHDGVLSMTEREAVDSMHLEKKGIKSLQGIEYFTDLVVLDASNNELTSLDLSHNKKLTMLYCYYNQISELKISGNLQILNCTGNALTELDVSSFTKLEQLGCGENEITKLDVSKNLNLTRLDFNKNKVKTIDVSKNTKLTYLNCKENALAELDVRKNSELSSLSCAANDIVLLDVASNVKLQSLSCTNTNITSIDLSKNPNLKELYIRLTKIRSIDVSNNPKLTILDVSYNDGITELDVSKNTSLSELNCNSCRLLKLNLNTNTKLKSLMCKQNLLTELDVSKCTSLEEVYCEMNFIQQEPDVPETCKLYFAPQKNCPDVKNLKVTEKTINSITLSWSQAEPVDGLAVEGYILYRSTSQDGEYESLISTSETSYTDKNLKPDTTYYYKVGAYIIVSDVIIHGKEAGPVSGVTLKITTTPTKTPSGTPSKTPTKTPTKTPSGVPTKATTKVPTKAPTTAPSGAPTGVPTGKPRKNPTTTPTGAPTGSPTGAPTGEPTGSPKPGDPTPTTKPGAPTPTPNQGQPTTKPGDPTPTPAPAQEKEPLIADFVERLYTIALDRESDPEGKAFWIKDIESGNRTGGDCAHFFLIEAPEFLNRGLSDDDFVETLYKTFFDRASEPAGKKFWVGSLKNGTMTKENVINGFIDSAEWCNVCATYGVKSGAPNAKAEFASKNATDFATRLYTCCLGRDPEAKGLTYWSLALTNLEQTGYAAAELFFTSEEFINLKTTDEEYVKRLYTTFMGRDPEASEIAFWTGELTKGSQTRTSTLEFFGHSEEFTAICKQYGIDRG